MADSEKVSSLPSERERFEELASRFGLSLEKDGIVGDYINNETWGAWQVWLSASAGRQELLDALRFIVERENFAFAECTEAEAIWSRAKSAIAKATQGA